MQIHVTAAVVAIAALVTCGSALAQKPSSAIKPIDPELVAKNFKRGKFASETSTLGDDGKMRTESEVTCMDEMAANMLPFGAMMGLANCEPVSTNETKTSMSVAGLCRKGSSPDSGKSPFVPNFYTGSVSWSADGTTIDLEMRRVALINDKPSDKVLMLIKHKLAFQAPNCAK
jgi:hypothetical protein